MATRANPFYAGQYANPGMAGLSSAIGAIASAFAQQRQPQVKPQDQALADQRMQAAATDQLQGAKYAAETQGITAKNTAMQSAPSMLAELFMNGGQFADDPLQENPSFDPQAMAVTDYGLGFESMSKPMPAVQSMFMPTMTARDKMGAAMQEAMMRGAKPQDFAELLGQAAYLSKVQGGNPDAGMGYLPLMGKVPTNTTALSPQRQDAVSARDAAESLRQATTTANITQAGAMARQQARQASKGGTRPVGEAGDKPARAPGRQPVPINIAPKDLAALKQTIKDDAQARGLPELDDAALRAAAIEAGTRYQGSRNAGQAVQSVMDDLERGTLAGFEQTTETVPGKRFWNSDTQRKVIKRNATGEAPAPAPVQAKATGAKPVDPNIEAARAAIARGAPRNLVIKRLRENGIDPAGL